MLPRRPALLLRLGCVCLCWLVALVPVGQAAPTGKLAPERRDKNEWRQAINDWQANENQEFMQQYEEGQRERERIRQRNAPKFDPTNPKACAHCPLRRRHFSLAALSAGHCSLRAVLSMRRPTDTSRSWNSRVQ
jgi:hypothetical protein